MKLGEVGFGISLTGNAEEQRTRGSREIYGPGVYKHLHDYTERQKHIQQALRVFIIYPWLECTVKQGADELSNVRVYM